MIGPIYNNPLLLQSYRLACSVYIHGHSAGGTNPSLVEAMASEKPILAHNNVFNRETTGNLAFYFSNSAELALHLANLHLEKYIISGQALRKFAFTEYNWKKAAMDLSEMFNRKKTGIV